MENNPCEPVRVREPASGRGDNGCVGILTEGCAGGCASCCFFYVLLLISFVLGAIGFLILLSWIFSSLFFVPGSA